MYTLLVLVCKGNNLRQQLSSSSQKQSLQYVFMVHNNHHMISSCFLFQKEVALILGKKEGIGALLRDEGRQWD